MNAPLYTQRDLGGLVRIRTLLAIIPGLLAHAGTDPPAVREREPALVLDSQRTLDPEIRKIVSEVDAGRIAADIATLVGFGTRNSCSDASGASSGIGAARDFIRERLLSIPGLEVTYDSFAAGGCPGAPTRQNVLAWLPGTGHPERLIVIGGHYDSRATNAQDGVSPAPGANDSGSQAAAVIEAARVLSSRSYDATIVFAAWAGEEQGLFGSTAFLAHYRTLFPSGVLELNLTLDIVGGDSTANDEHDLLRFRLYSPGTPREVLRVSDGTPDDTSPSRGLMRHVGAWGGAYVPGFEMIPMLREDRRGRGSDHRSFIARGVPGVRFIDAQETPAHQHSPDDLLSFVTPAYTARIVQVVAATTASLARSPTPPLSMVAKGNLGSLDVGWTAPLWGPAVDHYVVSARPVTENFYRVRVVVPASASSFSLRRTEDLGLPAGSPFYVSLAAVDAKGHESLYAYPEYRCDASGCEAPADALDVTASK